MVKKQINKLKFWGILSAIGFVVGIQLIILGASNIENSALAVVGLVVGIVLVVVGFYGTPLIWTHRADLKKCEAVCDLITEKNVDTISLLASTLGVKESVALNLVRECIAKRYLTEYTVVENQQIVKLDIARKAIARDAAVLKGEAKVKKCTNCGSNLTFEGQKYVDCPYCGTRNFSK